QHEVGVAVVGFAAGGEAFALAVAEAGVGVGQAEVQAGQGLGQAERPVVVGVFAGDAGAVEEDVVLEVVVAVLQGQADLVGQGVLVADVGVQGAVVVGDAVAAEHREVFGVGGADLEAVGGDAAVELAEVGGAGARVVVLDP